MNVAKRTAGFSRLITASLALCLIGPAASWANQDHESIRKAAEGVVTAHLSPGKGRMVAVADPLDDRLHLAECGSELDAKLPYGISRKSRVTTEISCAGPEPWKLYVPVRLEIWQKVLVAAGPLQRGMLLSPGDMILAERTVTDQIRGFMLDPAQAAGYRLKRNLSEGDVITPGSIVAPPLIKRGQKVTLEARTGGLRIQMAGIALQEGMAGEVIAVENSESGRRVEGVVRSAKSVEVLLH